MKSPSSPLRTCGSWPMTTRSSTTTPKGPLDSARRARRRGRVRRGGAGRPRRRRAAHLRAPDRQRRAAQRQAGARARAPQGSRRRGRQAPPDRVQPAPRDLDREGLCTVRPAAARPDPGGQPRPDPRSREVRLHQGLQALDLRHLVDPPVHVARHRRPGPHDPPPRARRGHGQAPAPHESLADAGARPRRHRRGARRGHGAARARASSS